MADTYTAEIQHQGETHKIEVYSDKTVLAAAGEAGLDLPLSCTAGVCTTCAAQLLEGEVDQTNAMGLSPDLQKDGYALLCVAYPRSDLKIVTEKEEAVYDRQFGQPSK